MPDSNSQYAWRQGLGGLRYDPSMPEWLRRQYEWQEGEGGGSGQWVMRDAPVDEEGNTLILADDRGDIVANGENELIDGKTARWIPGLGWAANADDTRSTGKFERRQRRNQMIAGTIIGGSALAGLALAGGAGAAGGAAAGGEGLGAAGGAGGLGLELGAGGNGVLQGGSAVTGWAPTGGSAGGLAGLGQAAAGGGGVAPEGLGLALEGYGGGAGAAGAGGSSMLSQAYNAVGGAQGIGRLGMGLASLGAASSGGGGSGGETDPQNIIEQMANANRVDHNTPIGNRRWTKDPVTGRWTVTDSMSPEEQANFSNVQGLNSSVTQMARDRLAALLAQPRKRYDRPYGS